MERKSNTSNCMQYLYAFFSMLLISTYYTLIAGTSAKVITIKVYHSLYLGLISTVSYFYFERKVSSQEISREELLPTAASELSNKNSSYLILILGTLSFLIELSVFYLILCSKEENLNIAMVYCLTTFEFAMIRFYESMKSANIVFIQFIGIVIEFVTFIIISLMFFTFPFSGLGLAISACKFVNYYLHIQLRFLKDRGLYIHLMHVYDFAYGLILFVAVVSLKLKFWLSIKDICFILAGSCCYFLNSKFFPTLKGRQRVVLAFIYPMLALLDFVVNGRKVSTFQLVLLIVMSLSIGLSQKGHKLLSKASWTGIEEECCDEQKCLNNPLTKLAEGNSNTIYINHDTGLITVPKPSQNCTECSACFTLS